MPLWTGKESSMPVPSEMKFGHIGLYVTDLEKMLDFYTNLMQFRITDRGSAMRSGAELVFLSRDPEEHHQIVLATGRPDGNVSPVNQISFRVENIEQVRAAYDAAVEFGVEGITPINHGSALSVYFPDPEGNRMEVYMATPWYIAQPHAKPLDFSQSNEEILKVTEDKCRADPTFKPMDQWKAEFPSVA